MATDSVRGSQSPILVGETTHAKERVSQSSVLAGQTASAKPRISQTAILVGFGPPPARKVNVSQTVVLVAYKTIAKPKISDVAILVSWGSGSRDNPNLRAWGFSLDGHEFYVLTLGSTGTFVYDFTTGQWTRFETEGLPIWNMEKGLTWKNLIVAGDNQNPTVWKLDPNSFLDDGFKPIKRVVTGGIPARQRGFFRQFSFSISASTGQPSASLVNQVANIELFISDDAGKSFVSVGSVEIQEGVSSEIAWRSLGMIRAPGRVFKIEDVGAVARIDGADADIDGIDQ